MLMTVHVDGKDETIFKKGNPVNEMLIIQQGRVQILSRTEISKSHLEVYHV